MPIDRVIIEKVTHSEALTKADWAYKQINARRRAVVKRLRDGDIDLDHQLSVRPLFFHPITHFRPVETVEVDSVRVPELFDVNVITKSGWFIELTVRIRGGGDLEIWKVLQERIDGIDSDPPGQPYKSWAHEGLTRLLAELADGNTPLAPRPSRPGRVPVSDAHLTEAVHLYDEEGLSLREVARQMTGSKNGSTAKRWLTMAEERGLR